MRKNSPRKWLHAILDLLPLFVIPVFMIYSHRHTIDSYSVTRTEVNEVNVYQFVINGKPVNTDYYTFGGGIFTVNNNGYLVLGDNVDTNFTLTGDVSPMVVNNNDKLFYSYTDFSTVFCDLYFGIGSNDSGGELEIDALFNSGTSVTYSGDFEWVSDTDTIDYFYINGDFDGELYIKDIMFFNLTTIFGSGNEPTGDVFRSYLIKDYYSVGYNSLNIGYHNVTYNDTDIGSQFVYTMYNTTEKYFNFNKVFNLQGFYNWIEVNLFGGNAPLIACVVWNIIVYEFVIDLLFVFYAFFMFLIDFTDSLLEKPFNKGR